MDKDERIEAVQAEQCWTDDTLLILALRFIASYGQTEDFAEFLEGIAEDENV